LPHSTLPPLHCGPLIEDVKTPKVRFDRRSVPYRYWKETGKKIRGEEHMERAGKEQSEKHWEGAYWNEMGRSPAHSTT
jgi:hypothetical protein